MKKFLIGSLIFTICAVSVVSGITYNKYNNIKKFLNNDKDVKYIEDYKESEVKYNVIDNKVIITVPNSSLDSRASEDVLKLEEELIKSKYTSSKKEEHKNNFRSDMMKRLDKAKKNIESNLKEEMGLDIDVVVNLK